MNPRKKKFSGKRDSAARDQILNKPPRTARQVVFRVLEHAEKTGEFFGETLQTLSDQAPLTSEDRRLAREIVAGVIRRKATLDALISANVRRPRENTEESLWLLLRMGTYELAFLDRIPAHASVNETTELARFLRRPRWTGFLNGTLRSISRGLTEDFTERPAANAFPVTPGQYRPCAEAWFPDPQTHPADYFAAAFSFPHWLTERWQRELSFDELIALGFWFNTPSPLMLRVNPLKTSREELLKTFPEQAIPATAAELAQAIELTKSQNITELPGFAEGHFTVQDLTAMKAVDLLNPQPGETVWDLCAAPGTKTTAIAERMQNQGRVVATDINPARLTLIEENRSRLGLDAIEVQAISSTGEDFPAGPFDAVLVDVPCSNTGVLGKRPEARWRLRPQDFEELPVIQRQLLEAACQRVKQGGRVVYSTCSIEPEENQILVEAFLSCRPDWELLEQHTHWPGQPADGGYSALLRHMRQKPGADLTRL